MDKKNIELGIIIGVLLILISILMMGPFSNYRWSSSFDWPLPIEKCLPNVNISIKNCSVIKNSIENELVQQCEFENVSKYPITIGYKPGKYYQKVWTYNVNGDLTNRVKTVKNIPEVLDSGAIAHGLIAYHADTEKIILCPIDPAKIKKRGVALFAK